MVGRYNGEKHLLEGTIEMTSGQVRRIEIEGRKIALVRVENEYYAVGDVCSHANFSLSEGDVYVEEREIECWKHGSTFSLLDGKPQCLPATAPVPTYEVIREDDRFYLILGDQ